MKNGTTQANRNKQRRRIRLVLFIMLGFSAWTCYTLYTQSGDLAQKKLELEELNKDALAVKETQSELNYKVSRLNDKEYIAELARKDYFLAKPGEVIYVLPNK